MMPAPLQPTLEQFFLASRYAVCSAEAPAVLEIAAALEFRSLTRGGEVCDVAVKFAT
jgi:hypothetical protein